MCRQGFAPRCGNILLKHIHPSLQTRQMSSSLPAEIPRQKFSLSLALCAGEILPRAKPIETSFVNRSTSSAKNELAMSDARNAACTSPSQIAIACFTAASRRLGA
jgi:hypothetical protein